MNDFHIIEELVTLIVMACALSADAFSVALGMGLIRLRLRQMFAMGIAIGLFHMIMPLMGILLGGYLSDKLGHITMLIGSILLIGLGLHMIFSMFGKEEERRLAPVGVGLWVFSISVSMDSFSIGLSLGMTGAQVWLAILLFGTISMLLTWFGLFIGRYAGKVIGVYGELLGGCILVAFGIKLLFFSQI
jgi:manganese efflux pump family protein